VHKVNLTEICLVPKAKSYNLAFSVTTGIQNFQEKLSILMLKLRFKTNKLLACNSMQYSITTSEYFSSCIL